MSSEASRRTVPIRIGFTGTRKGMTAAQTATLRQFLEERRRAGAVELHHGDCIGADAQAHDIAAGIGFTIAIHPPTDASTRAWKKASKGSWVFRELPYLQRNRSIVRATEMLVAAPAEGTEQLRSGTWATVRFARNAGRPVAIVGPDGVIDAGQDDASQNRRPSP